MWTTRDSYYVSTCVAGGVILTADCLCGCVSCERDATATELGEGQSFGWGGRQIGRGLRDHQTIVTAGTQTVWTIATRQR